jgi:phospholipase C
LITYDEHGGNYDHVAPPWGATPPGDGTVGENGFDFTRFGVRVPALLISPRTVAGTVFRAKRGVIDHTSVLKTIELLWGLNPLTARDKAAPDLGDVLTLAAPRADDPLVGIQIPVSNAKHPNSAQPSHIDLIHAAKVADLPLRNEQGSYDKQIPPDLSSSAAISDYIQMRTAAWTQHLQRMRKRAGRNTLSKLHLAGKSGKAGKGRGKPKSKR